MMRENCENCEIFAKCVGPSTETSSNLVENFLPLLHDNEDFSRLINFLLGNLAQASGANDYHRSPLAGPRTNKPKLFQESIAKCNLTQTRGRES